VDDCLEVQLSFTADPADPADRADLAESADSADAAVNATGGGRQVGWAVHLIPDGREQPQIPDWFGYRPI
jgi:hypothetical protein